MQTITVSFTLGKILKARGIKPEKFSADAKLHYRTILSISNNKTDRIDKTTISKICAALEISPGELFELTPAPSA